MAASAGSLFGRTALTGPPLPANDSTASNNELTHNAVAVTVDGGSDNLVQGNNIHDNGQTSSGQRPNSDGTLAAVVLTDNWADCPTGNEVGDNTITNSGNHGISVRVDGTLITGNTISNSGLSYPAFREPAGIEVEGSGSECGADNTEIFGNTITGSAFAGIKLGASVDNTTIDDNTISGTLNGGANGGPSSGGTNSGGAAILITQGAPTHTAITNNFLTNNSGWGILQTDGNDPVPNAAQQNDITGNALGGVENRDGENFDARDNWWGAASGPSGAGPGTGDSVSTGVLFDPWATAPIASYRFLELVRDHDRRLGQRRRLPDLQLHPAPGGERRQCEQQPPDDRRPGAGRTSNLRALGRSSSPSV